MAYKTVRNRFEFSRINLVKTIAQTKYTWDRVDHKTRKKSVENELVRTIFLRLTCKSSTNNYLKFYAILTKTIVVSHKRPKLKNSFTIK